MNWGAVGALLGLVGFAFGVGSWVTNSEHSDKALKEKVESLANAQRTMELETSFPQGAVVAFYSDECPSGWQDYKELSGRVIVGVGKGSGLQLRSLGDVGGKESHLLTVEELPPHNHAASRVPWGQLNWKGGDSDPFWARNGGKYEGYTTGNSGGGKEHNNMQPYLALLYCRKL
ncbi:phage tail protein [Vibrio parahaemolyticus]|uniref:phage tail protein n=1 Tax=Vibrio parahaemolyticus TaxID=670 RepID=UPI003891696B